MPQPQPAPPAPPIPQIPPPPGGAGNIIVDLPSRPLTRFEQRGLDAGRAVHDLTYRRVTPAAP